MRILISGICGFVATTLAEAFARPVQRHKLAGLDDFIRPGSELNRARLKPLGVKLHDVDLRAADNNGPFRSYA
jgi:CDP-paratose 2-epimerase